MPMTAMPERDDRRPIRALTVASWFPAVDDSTKGRFVADQVDALRATRLVDPIVLSFEPAQLTGAFGERRHQGAAVEAAAARALAGEEPPFARMGWTGPVGVPVARLPIPSGNRAFAVPTHHARARSTMLVALAERLGDASRTIVHAHTGYPDGAAAATFAERLGAPLVITEHATFLDKQLAQPAVRAAYAASVARASRLIAVSGSLAAELRRRLPEHAAKVVVVPNVVAMDAFRITPPGQRRPDALLYVGYRTETKGIDILLAAFARVRAVRPDATLRLVGRSPTPEIEDQWRVLARQLGVGDAVDFDGPRLRHGVAAAMAQASVLVHASRLETFGIVPVEALASGLPVVATATGAVCETFGTDPTSLGALVPVGDAEALAAGILDTLARRATFDPQRLRDAVEARFGRDVVAHSLVDLYRTVLEEAAPRHHAPRARSAPRHAGDGDASTPTTAGAGTALDELLIWSPAGEPDGATTIVVGLDAPRTATLLGSLPGGLRARLTVLTSILDADTAMPAGLAATVTVDLRRLEAVRLGWALPVEPRGGMPQRVLRVVRHPRSWLGTRRAQQALEAARAEGVRAAVDAARSATGGTAPRIVCLDGRDYLAAAGVLADGSAVGVPGGLRWLADRHATMAGPRASTPGSPAPEPLAAGARGAV
jgi:glycogen(starch) synthase